MKSIHSVVVVILIVAISCMEIYFLHNFSWVTINVYLGLLVTNFLIIDRIFLVVIKDRRDSNIDKLIVRTSVSLSAILFASAFISWIAKIAIDKMLPN